MSLVPSSGSKYSVTDNQYERFRMQKDIGVELIKNIKKVLRDEDINFTQDLSNSFVFEVKTGFPSETNVGTSSVLTNNPYANLVDKGMRPGNWVNFDALYDWVRIKIGLEEPELTPVTWKIIKKIQNKGIDPTHFAKKAIKMVIGKHGIAGTKRKYNNKSKSTSKSTSKFSKIKTKINKVGKKVNKTAKKVNKILKKVRKNVTKTSNLRKINKGLRQINKYGVRSLNMMGKYK